MQLIYRRGFVLCHVVGKDGVRANPSLVLDVEHWPIPQNLKELQAFLGLQITIAGLFKVMPILH